ncbi:hypothetical protein RGQ29_021861 [Quercus rubra]|uniref:FYVE-type domain-containing protein n=1 Tax=Quercus rubra TaxID=3512 RepID=A0AAN7F1G0_QUERU|nr:hypothetical protein RGQ29_021861 [Quercus rubra]
MQQNDINASNYQYYQPPHSHFQNPNPNPSFDHNLNPMPYTYASAPPIPYSDADFSSAYPPYPLNPQSYDPSSYIHNFDPNPSFSDNSYSAPYASNFGLSTPNYDEVLGGGGGVYAYDGGNSASAGSEDSGRLAFDDYGRPINMSGPEDRVGQGHSGKVIKAIPKTEMEEEEDVKSGVRKFRVQVLAENGGQSDMDVLCQIGLDGIRMLVPATSRTLRIYPLETVTTWEVLDASVFAFWAKSSIDLEPRCIRLYSNSYTTNAILDMVTAAVAQLNEMGGNNKPSNSVKVSDQFLEKKKGFGDWMYLVKPGNEEKDHWVPDDAVNKCSACSLSFGAFVRKHHCRNCGDIFCDMCTQGRIALTADDQAPPVRVCDQCMAEVTQRLSYGRETSEGNVKMHSHEDLAKKLQEEMGRNRKTSGLEPAGPGMQMSEVACPICTVHLKVQVPSTGSETIECSVCQHPFLVSAH